MIRVGVIAVVLSLTILASCGARQPETEAPRGTLRFTAEVKDAILEVDEQRVGPIGLFSEQGLMLKPGQHRIIVRRAGYFDFYLLVDVQENDLKIIEVPLRPIPD